MKRRRKNPPGVKVAKPSGRGKTFAVRIPGVNISVSLQPTRKGITIVKPRVSKVTISRGGENPRWHRMSIKKGNAEVVLDGYIVKGRKKGRNPLQTSSTPGHLGPLRPGTTTTRGFVG